MAPTTPRPVPSSSPQPHPRQGMTRGAGCTRKRQLANHSDVIGACCAVLVPLICQQAASVPSRKHPRGPRKHPCPPVNCTSAPRRDWCKPFIRRLWKAPSWLPSLLLQAAFLQPPNAHFQFPGLCILDSPSLILPSPIPLILKGLQSQALERTHSCTSPRLSFHFFRMGAHWVELI